MRDDSVAEASASAREAAAFCSALKDKGVLAGALGPRVVRFVTHFDVTTGDCEQAARVVGQMLKGWG